MKKQYKDKLRLLSFGIIILFILKSIYLSTIFSIFDFNENSDLNYIIRIINGLISGSVIPIIVFSFIFKFKNLYSDEKIDNHPSFKNMYIIPLTLSLCFLSNIGSFISETLSGIFNYSTHENVYENIMPTNIIGVIVFYIVMTVLSPIMEEIIFRKIILNPFRIFGEVTAVIISSLFFSLYHGNYSQLFYTFLCGVLLGFTAIKTNSIKISILIHIFYNIISLSLYYLNTYNPPLSSIIFFITIILGAVSLGLLFHKKIIIFKEKIQTISLRDKLLLPLTEPFLLIGIVLMLI